MDFLKNLSLSDKTEPEPEAPVPPAPVVATASPPTEEQAHHHHGLHDLLGRNEPTTGNPLPPPPPPPAVALDVHSHVGDALRGMLGQSTDQHEASTSVPAPAVAIPPSEEQKPEHHSISSFFSGDVKKDTESPAPVQVVDATTATTTQPESHHHRGISNLFGTDKEKETPLPPPLAPAPVIAAVPEDKGFLSNIFGGHKEPEVPPPIPVAQPVKEEHHSILDHLIGQHETAQAPVVQAVLPEPEPESLLDKISSHLGSKDEAAPAPAPPPPAPAADSLVDRLFHSSPSSVETHPTVSETKKPETEEHLLDRIASHLGHEKTPPPPVPSSPKPKHQEILEKLGVHSSDSAPAPVPSSPKGFLGIHLGSDTPPPPAEPTSLADKILHRHENDTDKLRTA